MGQVSLLLDPEVEGLILNTGRDFDGQVAQSKHMQVWSNQTGWERKKKFSNLFWIRWEILEVSLVYLQSPWAHM